MGSLSVVILPDTLRTIDSATFTGNYLPVGSSLTRSMRLVKFLNMSTVSCTISWDGITDHDVVPANSFVLLDVAGNRENAGAFEIQAGTQFYVKGAAGSGKFYISCYYGK
jgi:hypothetical protein